MGTIVIYGNSDDLVEFEGVAAARDMRGADVHGQDSDNYPEAGAQSAEFPVYIKPSEYAGFIVCRQLVVQAYYREGWGFVVSYSDEGASRPDWPIRVMPDPDCEYSTRVEIDCPFDETEVLRTK